MFIDYIFSICVRTYIIWSDHRELLIDKHDSLLITIWLLRLRTHKVEPTVEQEPEPIETEPVTTKKTTGKRKIQTEPVQRQQPKRTCHKNNLYLIFFLIFT